ncbi:hypothetical protein [uncultured Croceitalea sp.]|uniref:hypothetical protein n=1 Tax=uncultured Croceitalea sp. TaxID=1798908 RepID=UPI0033063819
MNTKKNTQRVLLILVLMVSSNFYGQRFHKGKRTHQYKKDGVEYMAVDWRKEDLPQQEITSEMHRNNIGKIVFSDEKIPFKNEDPSKLKTHLNVSDNIYGRMYLLCSIPNDTLYATNSKKEDDRKGLNRLLYKNKISVGRGEDYYRDARASYRLFINGKLSSWAIQNVTFTEESLHHTTRQVWLAPKPEDEPVSRYWLQELDKLPEGEHTIRIEYIPGNDNAYVIRPLAVGEFTLVKSGDATVSTGIKYADLDEARKDPQLAKEVVRVMSQVYKDKGWKGTLQKVKFNTDWNSFYATSYDKLSRVREIRFYAYTTHDSGKCMVEEFTVGQAYNGNEFSGPLFYRRVIPGSKQRIDCD